MPMPGASRPARGEVVDVPALWNTPPRKREFELIVWDPPRPQGRKRMKQTFNGVTIYPERKDDAARYHIRKAWMDQYGEDFPLLEGDLALSMAVFLPAPKMMSLKRRVAGERPRGRGDLDNFEKAVLDALQGYAFVNDVQVQEHRLPFGKWYAVDPRDGKDTRPHIWLKLEEL